VSAAGLGDIESSDSIGEHAPLVGLDGQITRLCTLARRVVPRGVEHCPRKAVTSVGFSALGSVGCTVGVLHEMFSTTFDSKQELAGHGEVAELEQD
jgi:hypothetical protein